MTTSKLSCVWCKGELEYGMQFSKGLYLCVFDFDIIVYMGECLCKDGVALATLIFFLLLNE